MPGNPWISVARREYYGNMVEERYIAHQKCKHQGICSGVMSWSEEVETTEVKPEPEPSPAKSPEPEPEPEPVAHAPRMGSAGRKPKQESIGGEPKRESIEIQVELKKYRQRGRSEFFLKQMENADSTPSPFQLLKEEAELRETSPEPELETSGYLRSKSLPDLDKKISRISHKAQDGRSRHGRNSAEWDSLIPTPSAADLLHRLTPLESLSSASHSSSHHHHDHLHHDHHLHGHHSHDHQYSLKMGSHSAHSLPSSRSHPSHHSHGRKTMEHGSVELSSSASVRNLPRGMAPHTPGKEAEDFHSVEIYNQRRLARLAQIKGQLEAKKNKVPEPADSPTLSILSHGAHPSTMSVHPHAHFDLVDQEQSQVLPDPDSHPTGSVHVPIRHRASSHHDPTTVSHHILRTASHHEHSHQESHHTPREVGSSSHPPGGQGKNH